MPHLKYGFSPHQVCKNALNTEWHLIILVIAAFCSAFHQNKASEKLFFFILLFYIVSTLVSKFLFLYASSELQPFLLTLQWTSPIPHPSFILLSLCSSTLLPPGTQLARWAAPFSPFPNEMHGAKKCVEEVPAIKHGKNRQEVQGDSDELEFTLRIQNLMFKSLSFFKEIPPVISFLPGHLLERV